MSEQPAYPYDIPQIICRKYPTVTTPQVGILGERQNETHIEVEYIRKDIYNDLLKRVKEAYDEMMQIDRHNVRIGDIASTMNRHLPELEDK